MHDPDDNRLWDLLVGENTVEGTGRLVGLIILFVVAAGSAFYLLG